VTYPVVLPPNPLDQAVWAAASRGARVVVGPAEAAVIVAAYLAVAAGLVWLVMTFGRAPMLLPPVLPNLPYVGIPR
jgi:hypothetical protein